MRILVAGASGTIGRPLVARLAADGHEVFGTSRSSEGATAVEKSGGRPVLVDVLDADAVLAALGVVRPEIVIEQLTALPRHYTPDAMRASLAATTRVRTEGGHNVQAAAEAVGARRYIAQSGCYYYAPGPGLADERTPFASDGPPLISEGAAGFAAVERRVLGSDAVEGVVLRYGFFYGATTWYAPDGDVAGQVRRREFPIAGDGSGVWSFVHLDDAVAATVAAVDGAAPGAYNIADDHPAPLATWLPAYARWLDAPPPPRVPLAEADEDAAFYATRLRGASNAKARRELGFGPRPLPWLDRG